jgi:hypothetical protein
MQHTEEFPLEIESHLHVSTTTILVRRQIICQIPIGKLLITCVGILINLHMTSPNGLRAQIHFQSCWDGVHLWVLLMLLGRTCWHFLRYLVRSRSLNTSLLIIRFFGSITQRWLSICSLISHTSIICPRLTTESAHRLTLSSCHTCSSKCSILLPISIRTEGSSSSQMVTRQATDFMVSIWHIVTKNYKLMR